MLLLICLFERRRIFCRWIFLRFYR